MSLINPQFTYVRTVPRINIVAAGGEAIITPGVRYGHIRYEGNLVIDSLEAETLKVSGQLDSNVNTGRKMIKVKELLVSGSGEFTDCDFEVERMVGHMRFSNCAGTIGELVNPGSMSFDASCDFTIDTLKNHGGLESSGVLRVALMENTASVELLNGAIVDSYVGTFLRLSGNSKCNHVKGQMVFVEGDASVLQSMQVESFDWSSTATVGTNLISVFDGSTYAGSLPSLTIECDSNGSEGLMTVKDSSLFRFYGLNGARLDIQDASVGLVDTDGTVELIGVSTIGTGTVRQLIEGGVDATLPNVNIDEEYQSLYLMSGEKPLRIEGPEPQSPLDLLGEVPYQRDVYNGKNVIYLDGPPLA